MQRPCRAAAAHPAPPAPRLVQLAQRGPGLAGGHAGAVGLQHRLVHRTLWRREGAAHGPGARDVGAVAVQLAATVQQKQLVAAEHLGEGEVG